MNKKVEAKVEAIKFDFRKVVVETEFDKFEECDLRKVAGNNIHKGCGDIGIDEIARSIYKTGEAEIPHENINEIRAIIENSPIVYAYKSALLNILSKQTEA